MADDKTPIQTAQETLDKIEKANARSEELIKRQEQLVSDSILAGKSVLAKQEAPKVETAAEYRDRVMGYKR